MDIKRLKELSSVREKDDDLHVGWDWNRNEKDDPKLAVINRALQTAGAEERLELALWLFKLWCEHDKRMEEANETFGKDRWASRKYRRVMFTLVGDSKTSNEGLDIFRIWYDLPRSFTRNYVDSCGHGVLLQVSGKPKDVHPYTTAFTQKCSCWMDQVPENILLGVRN